MMERQYVSTLMYKAWQGVKVNELPTRMSFPLALKLVIQVYHEYAVMLIKDYASKGAPQEMPKEISNIHEVTQGIADMILQVGRDFEATERENMVYFIGYREGDNPKDDPTT